jgi:general secretion pathway protein F
MSAFEYTALDAQGRERKGLIEGDTPKHVRQLLRDKQLLPMEIQETAQRELKQSRRRGFMRRGLSTLDLALLTRQLATLLRSGCRSRNRCRRSPSRPKSRACNASS